MKTLIFLLTFLSTSALADHANWSSSRGGWYSGSYQFITQSEVLNSKVTENDVSKDFKGIGFKTGLGTELARFVRFSAYHSYRDLSHNPSNSLRGSELGVDCKTSFYGPVVNMNLGLGLYSMRLLSQTPEDALVYFGTGSAGLIGFERFLSSRSSVVFDVRVGKEELRSEVQERNLFLRTAGAALSLLLWFD